jgi:hypothetical protein
MKIYEAFNWIKEADYTPHGYLIFNNSPEGQLKGEALKTIFEAAKKGELVTLEMFEAVKKERNDAVKRLNELLNRQKTQMSDEFTEQIVKAREKICDDFCKYTHEKHRGRITQEALNEICDIDCPMNKL